MDDSTLTKLLCALIGGIPTFDWPEHTPTGIAVFYGRIDPSPDRAVGVRVYGSDDERYLNQRRVQLRIRGRKEDRADADTIASVIFAVLPGLSRVGGISGIRRESMTPLGADQNGREERTENYTITLDNLEVLS